LITSLDLSIEILLEADVKDLSTERDKLWASSAELQKLLSKANGASGQTNPVPSQVQRKPSNQPTNQPSPTITKTQSIYPRPAPIYPFSLVRRSNFPLLCLLTAIFPQKRLSSVSPPPSLLLLPPIKNADAMVSEKQSGTKRLKTAATAVRRMSLGTARLQSIEGLTLQEVQRAKNSFKVLDKSEDGYLTADELTDYFTSIGNIQSSKDVSALMLSIDSNSDGTVNFEEFLRIIIHLKSAHNDVSNLLKKRKQLHSIGTDSWIIHPHHPLQMVWEMTMTLLLLMLVVTMPLTIAFDPVQESMSGLNLAIDVFFLIDVVKNFFTGVVNDENVVILDNKIVRKQYLRGWFLAGATGSGGLVFSSSLPYPPALAYRSDLVGSDGYNCISRARRRCQLRFWASRAQCQDCEDLAVAANRQDYQAVAPRLADRAGV
jgi:hypothetical protein